MKKLISLLLLTGAVLALTGCQSTPDDPIVAGKSSNDLLEKAAAETSGALLSRVDAPERYEAAFASSGGELNVTVDAAVTVPEADAVPIIRVTPVNITQEQADALMDTLVQGPLYAFDQPKTKAEIADKIVEAKRQLAEGPTEEDEGTVYFTEDGEMTWEEHMQSVVDQLQQEYDAAPETVEVQPATSRFEQCRDDGATQAGGENTTEQGWEALDVFDGPEGQEYFSTGSYVRAAEKTGYVFDYQPAETFNDFYPYADVDIASLPDVTITEQEAQALCDEVVEALDIPNMTFYAVCKKYGGGSNTPRCCWELQYTRNIGGVPIAYSSVGMTIEGLPQEGEIFRFPWDNEKLNFYVNDEGIVGMDWGAPYALGETVAEDAALMDFADVMDIFQKMFVVKYDGQPMDVTIDSIRLSYMRVSEQDKNYTGLLVPVWDFYGTELWHPEDGEDYTSFYDPDYSFLTINAVDGTIIDRSQGY